jgi:6,7-dimethyl-8-ribityllumazine synthase
VPHLLIIEARFYDDLADELLRGAVGALERAGATYERVTVPGALEIPAALAMALEAVEQGRADYDGYVALGTVIRGETTHYETVAGESARGLMEIAVDEALAVGNGILTVENEQQAWARARVDDQNKGGAAASAALRMIALRAHFGL